jgi:hypothetical protein
MFRHGLIIWLALCAGAGSSPAAAQPQPAPQIAPIGSSTVGPWEGVAWGVGRRVHFCTLVRTKVPTGEPSYGLLIDQKGTLFSVETDAWTLPHTPIDVTIKPTDGRERSVSARPVSPRRANIDISKDKDLLGQFQRSEQVEVRANGVTVRLAFDDFNAARVVFEACAQQIGRELAPPAR